MEKIYNTNTDVAFCVVIGATVSCMLNNSKIVTLTIKTSKETDPVHGIVSCESPIGKALLNKREHEVFQYTVGERVFTGEVLKIEAPTS